MANKDISQIYSLGRCEGSLGGEDLGILDEVQVTCEHFVDEVVVPAYAGPIDAVERGWAVFVEATIHQADYDTILPLLTGFTKKAETYEVVGTATETETAIRVAMGGLGGEAAATAVLRLKSSIAARADGNEVRLWKAYLASCTPTIVFAPEQPAQQGFRLRFNCLPDASRDDGDQLASYGDFTGHDNPIGP
jgi:hypothetical protein